MKNFLRTAKSSFCFNDGAKEVTRLYQPFLNRWEFKNFYYVQISKTGELVYLTNHVDYAIEYWEEGLPLRTGFQEVCKGRQSFSGLWEESLDQEILDFAASNRCYSGFSFVERYPDSIQFASFLSSSPREGQFYLKNQGSLRCWVREFVRKNRGLIGHAKQKALVLPSEYLAPEKAAFYPKRTLDLCYSGIKSQVTFRQLDCLHLYCRGFTYSHIAELLALSPRTVETHLEAVKNSFGLGSRDELAALAYGNELIEQYSPRLTLR